MSYSERLSRQEDWSTAEEALEESVESYSDKKGLAYEMSMEAEARDIRLYSINGPDLDSPLVLEVSRTAEDRSSADDEKERLVVTYNISPVTGPEIKGHNIRKEFQKITRPDSVNGEDSMFYEKPESIFDLEDPWNTIDEENLMEKAREEYNQEVGPCSQIDVELGYDSSNDWRIYEIDAEDLDETLFLEMTFRNWYLGTKIKNDDVNGSKLKYKNFLKYGFMEAISQI